MADNIFKIQSGGFSGRIVTVQPQVVPGLLQTAEYAHRLLGLSGRQDVPN